MPLTPVIGINNNATNPATFSVSDLSGGTDVTITTFQLLIYDDTNTLILGSPLNFTYTPNATYNINGLTQDYAISITANWLNAGGGTVDSTSIIGVLTGFLEWFYYSLVQQVAAKSNTASDTNFISNLSWLRTLIDSANQAITVGASIFNAANMLSIAQNLQTNQTLYF
jgi:hypothetical protein